MCCWQLLLVIKPCSHDGGDQSCLERGGRHTHSDLYGVPKQTPGGRPEEVYRDVGSVHVCCSKTRPARHSWVIWKQGKRRINELGSGRGWKGGERGWIMGWSVNGSHYQPLSDGSNRSAGEMTVQLITLYSCLNAEWMYFYAACRPIGSGGFRCSSDAF